MSATVAEIVWYQEDSLSPLTVSKPASFGVGQMLVFVLVQHNNPSNQTDLTTPSGWTFAGALDGTVVDGKVWYYTYTGSDPASWDFPYKATADVAGGLFRITGADVTTPTLVVSTTTGNVTSPMDSPSVTPTGTDDLLLALISDICNGTVLACTIPSGMTDGGLGEVTGHFMSSHAAYQQLSSGSATGVRTWTSVSPTGIEGGTWTVAIKSAASSGAILTPGPQIVSAAVRPAGTTPILLRSTLQDPPVLTTRSPYLVTSSLPVLIPRPLTLRSTLADPPVLVSTQPQLVTSSVPMFVPRPLLYRSTLADPSQLTTPGPQVVTGPAKMPAGGVQYIRSSLVDATVVTGTPTPAPIVIGPTYTVPPVLPVLLFRSTLADPIPQTTQGPIVVSTTSRPTPGGVLQVRGSLFDAATPGPYLVTTTSRTPVGAPLLLRSSLFDAATVGPYVVSSTVRATFSPATLLRNPAAPAVVVTGQSTPQPYLVTAASARVGGTVLLLASRMACDCITHRPNTGTTARGSAGTTTRPFTGITQVPCSC